MSRARRKEPNATVEITGFTAPELNVTPTVSGKKVVWRPGMKDPLNLNDTLNALDCAPRNERSQPCIS